MHPAKRLLSHFATGPLVKCSHSVIIYCGVYVFCVPFWFPARPGVTAFRETREQSHRLLLWQHLPHIITNISFITINCSYIFVRILNIIIKSIVFYYYFEPCRRTGTCLKDILKFFFEKISMRIKTFSLNKIKYWAPLIINCTRSICAYKPIVYDVK